MNQDHQMTILIVTHDLAGLGDYVQQLVYLDKTVVFSGSFRDFCQNAALSPYIHTHDIKGCDAP
jgi:zinc transport system ATP-binding protein